MWLPSWVSQRTSKCCACPPLLIPSSQFAFTSQPASRLAQVGFSPSESSQGFLPLVAFCLATGEPWSLHYVAPNSPLWSLAWPAYMLLSCFCIPVANLSGFPGLCLLLLPQTCGFCLYSHSPLGCSQPRMNQLIALAFWTGEVERHTQTSLDP